MRVLIFIAFVATSLIVRADPDVQVPLSFTGGHETEERDHGRPVLLIAAALGVSPAVFREAFSHVHPAPEGEKPRPGDVRQNKRELLKRLAPYGVTNARLDQVSNYYRFQRGTGNLWTYRDAQGYVTMHDGNIMAVTVVDPGNGYTSTPEVYIPGQPDEHFTATIHLDRDIAKNGSIAQVAIVR
jgi:hypothetical protein